MILSSVVLACDVPTCAAQLRREHHGETQARTVARIREDGRRAGWWVDALGRAWCPTHRAQDQHEGSGKA